MLNSRFVVLFMVAILLSVTWHNAFGTALPVTGSWLAGRAQVAEGAQGQYPVTGASSLAQQPTATRIPVRRTPTPRVEPSAIPIIPSVTTTPMPEWLEHLNQMRVTAGLLPVTENAEWSQANSLHAQYMVKNNVLLHDEDVNNPWYTEEGATAASASNLWVSGRTELTSTTILNNWMVAPFHGVALLDPQLLEVGYGDYREEDGGIQLGAGIDVQRGLAFTLPVTITFPVVYPPDDGYTPFTSFDGEEFPDPLSSCPGFVAPVGPPIYLQLGAGELRPDLGAHTLTVNGKLVPHCIFTEISYRHPDDNIQAIGRLILDGRDAIVLLPRKPLSPGAAIRVAIAANGSVHKWDFEVTEDAPASAPLPTPTGR